MRALYYINTVLLLLLLLFCLSRPSLHDKPDVMMSTKNDLSWNHQPLSEIIVNTETNQNRTRGCFTMIGCSSQVKTRGFQIPLRAHNIYVWCGHHQEIHEIISRCKSRKANHKQYDNNTGEVTTGPLSSSRLMIYEVKIPTWTNTWLGTLRALFLIWQLLAFRGRVWNWWTPSHQRWIETIQDG